MQRRDNPEDQQSFYEYRINELLRSLSDGEDSLQASLDLFKEQETIIDAIDSAQGNTLQQVDLLRLSIVAIKLKTKPQNDRAEINTNILNAIFEILFLYQAFLHVKYQSHEACDMHFKKDNPYSNHVMEALGKIEPNAEKEPTKETLQETIQSIQSPRQFEAAQIRQEADRIKAGNHKRIKAQPIPTQEAITRDEKKLEDLFLSIQRRANTIVNQITSPQEVSSQANNPSLLFTPVNGTNNSLTQQTTPSAEESNHLENEEHGPKETTSYLKMACAGVALVVGIGACITGVGALIGVPLIIGSVSVLAGSLAVGIGGLLSIGSGGFLGHKAFSLFARTHEPVASIETDRNPGRPTT